MVVIIFKNIMDNNKIFFLGKYFRNLNNSKILFLKYFPKLIFILKITYIISIISLPYYGNNIYILIYENKLKKKKVRLFKKNERLFKKNERVLRKTNGF